MDSRGAHSVCRGLFALVRAAEPTGRDSTKVLGVHVNLASTLTAATVLQLGGQLVSYRVLALTIRWAPSA